MRLKVWNIGKANAEIQVLRGLAGLPAVDSKFLNIIRANREIERLSGLVKAGNKAPAPPAPKPAAAPAPYRPPAQVASAPPAPPATPKLTRAECIRVMLDVFREATAFSRLSDSALCEDTLARVRAESLTLPGEPKLSTEGWPPYKKMLRSQKQDRLLLALRK